jgi:hypothetical protein
MNLGVKFITVINVYDEDNKYLCCGIQLYLAGTIEPHSYTQRQG